jgi:hypothetical protein
MRHMETRLCSPDMSSGHFFCPPTSPLTLPSPQWGEGDAKG